MIIYVDTLIFTNIIVDYLLLNLTVLIVKNSYSLKRLIISSLIGGFSSLYIFVEAPIILDIIYRFLVAGLMILILNARSKLKPFLYSLSIFLMFSFALNGLIIFLSYHQSNDIFVSENSVFYLNISPTLLIFATVVIYLAAVLMKRFAERRNKINSAKLMLKIGELSIEFEALVDTGNSVSDPFGSSQVFIINKDDFGRFEKAFSDREIKVRKRVIPITTVGDKMLLDAIRCDTAIISESGRIYEYQKPIAACAIETIGNGYGAIIPNAAIYRVE